MLMTASTEFVTLCRAQVALLTQALGASLSVVYLTQDIAEGSETQLVPLVMYPETEIARTAEGAFRLPETERTAPHLLTAADGVRNEPAMEWTYPVYDWQQDEAMAASHQLVVQRQMVLPLIHEEVVLGVLLTERSDRNWNEWEQAQIHQVAETLALACVLDQRYQWLHRNQQQQQLLQAQQHDILDNLLHQFRNSLTALQTFSKLILKRLLPGDANRDVAASLNREAARLRDLSQQLEQAATQAEMITTPLTLPALGDATIAGLAVPVAPLPATVGVLAETAIVLQPVSVGDVLQPLLASAQTIAQERHLSLHWGITSDLPMVQANAAALREVLNNLLENALKYTPVGGDVWVQVNPDMGMASQPGVKITVTNSGPGIPPEDLAHIFERRFRGIQAQGAIPGSGLGLAIASSLVAQMHGDIQVFSPAPTIPNQVLQHDSNQRRGAMFTVWLPLAPA